MNSYSTEGWKNHCLERDLHDFNSLISLPSINSCELEFKFDNYTVNYNKYSSGTIEDVKENCEVKVLENTIYYVYNSCLIKYEAKMDASIGLISDILKNENIDNFILDLRDNLGGASQAIKPLIDYLGNHKLNLYTFVNGNTFSSGIEALIGMKNIGSIVIGNDVGSPLNHFGVVDTIYSLPNTNFTFKVSTRFMPYNVNSINSREDYENMNKSLLTPVYFKPDYIIDEKGNNFMNNEDEWFNVYNKIIKNKNKF